MAKIAVRYGVKSLRSRHLASGAPPASTLTWVAAVWRIIRTPLGPMLSK
ncbi:MAG TPA: hypothetical protein VGJ18_25240 [Gemmatimonadaceae bacterium]